MPFHNLQQQSNAQRCCKDDRTDSFRAQTMRPVIPKWVRTSFASLAPPVKVIFGGRAPQRAASWQGVRSGAMHFLLAHAEQALAVYDVFTADMLIPEKPCQRELFIPECMDRGKIVKDKAARGCAVDIWRWFCIRRQRLRGL